MKFSEEKYKTADLIIDPERGVVLIKNETIRLGPVNMGVLMLLVHNQGNVVSRNQLFETVWKNQVVSDDTLTRSISDLRTRFSQYSSHKKLISTIPKKGYQWLPEVNKVTKNQSITKKRGAVFYLYHLVLLMVSVLILSIGVFAIADKIKGKHYLKVILMPIEYSDNSQKDLAIKIEDHLREAIQKTEHVRFLSYSLNGDNEKNAFIHLSDRFNVRWVVVGRIRRISEQNKVTLTLVDVRSNLEIFTLSNNHDVTFTSAMLLSQKFLDSMHTYID